MTVTALVVSRTVDFGVGRMGEMVAENLQLPFEFRVFWDFDPAETWLYSEPMDGERPSGLQLQVHPGLI